MKIIKTVLGRAFIPAKAISPLQMSLTLMLVLNLILSNILVVKPIHLFGIKELPNTLAIITFPMTYILSDVFQEVYGYRWSRVTATWAFLGMVLCSLLFSLMIAVPGSEGWANQEALVKILGNTPQIAGASLLAYWVGDLANDRVFRFMKNKNDSPKLFGVRAIGSSLVGKYVDGAIFTFIGLSFLPLEIKLGLVATAPFVQICLETALLPITSRVAKKLKATEQTY